MTIIFGTAIIIAYMINSMFGMTLMFAYSIHKLFFLRKGDFLYRILELMIMSLPMSYIGIAGTSMHQFFSWYNLFLIVFVLCVNRVYSAKIPLSKSATISLFVILICVFANLFWADNVGSELVEIAQILVMMVPIMIMHTVRTSFPLSSVNVYSLICEYVDVCVATAIAMLSQYVAYYFLHIHIGLIHFTGGNRVQFYGLFRGASILPIFMGIGIVFLFIECFEKNMTISRLAKIGIIFIAVVLNTSRTAIFTLMIVMALVCAKYISKRPSTKGIIISILGFTGSYYAIDYITTLRNRLSSFLDANGRQLTWENGIQIWSSNIKNLLIGEGFSGGRWDGITKPHNFIIQSLAQCGLIVTFIVLVMLIRYLYTNRNNPFIFLPIFILLSGMLVTDFYANAFTTVILILVDLYGGTDEFGSSIDKRKENEYERG